MAFNWSTVDAGRSSSKEEGVISCPTQPEIFESAQHFFRPTPPLDRLLPLGCCPDHASEYFVPVQQSWHQELMVQPFRSSTPAGPQHSPRNIHGER